MTVTDRDLAELLRERAAAAPYAGDRVGAVERRVRGVRRRRAAAVATVAAVALVTAAVTTIGSPDATDAPDIAATPTPSVPAVQPPAMPAAYGGGTLVASATASAGEQELRLSPSQQARRGRVTVVIRCDTGDVQVTGTRDGWGTVCRPGQLVDATLEEGGEQGAGVTVDAPQRAAWGAAMYDVDPRWASSPQPRAWRGKKLMYALGGEGTVAEVVVPRGATRFAVLVECSGAQSVQVRVNDATVGEVVSCSGVYEQRELTISLEEARGAGWIPGRTVTLSTLADREHNGTLVRASFYRA